MEDLVINVDNMQVYPETRLLHVLEWGHIIVNVP